MLRSVLAAVLTVVFAGGLAAADKPKEGGLPFDLPKLESGKDDSAEVKTAKAIIQAETNRIGLIYQRIKAGSFSGGSAYVQVTDSLRNMIEAADDAFPEPKDRLPWYEARLKFADETLKFNKVRVEKGVEEPQLLPQLEAEVARAELALLKLKKKVK